MLVRSIVAAVVALPTSIHGHGYMATPRSRQRAAHLIGDENCPHCYNGGSKGNVQINTAGDGNWPWPYEDPDEATRHGVCGDPADAASPRYEPLGEIVNENAFEEGSVIDATVFIKAHHKGHVELRLCEVVPWEDTGSTCPTSAHGNTQSCLNEHILLRTDDDGAMSGTEAYGDTFWDDYPGSMNDGYYEPCPDYNLLTVPGETWDGWDSCWPERYYIGSRNSTPKNGDERGWVANFKVKLPDSVTMKHGFLQMVYVTSNSCTPPGYRPSIQDMTSQSNTATCGSTLNAYPEEFWNCADVMIYPQGGVNSIADPYESVCFEKTYGDGATATTTTATTTTGGTATTTTATTGGSCDSRGSTCSNNCCSGQCGTGGRWNGLCK